MPVVLAVPPPELITSNYVMFAIDPRCASWRGVAATASIMDAIVKRMRRLSQLRQNTQPSRAGTPPRGVLAGVSVVRNPVRTVGGATSRPTTRRQATPQPQQRSDEPMPSTGRYHHRHGQQPPLPRGARPRLAVVGASRGPRPVPPALPPGDTAPVELHAVAPPPVPPPVPPVPALPPPPCVGDGTVPPPPLPSPLAPTTALCDDIPAPGPPAEPPPLPTSGVDAPVTKPSGNRRLSAQRDTAGAHGAPLTG